MNDTEKFLDKVRAEVAVGLKLPSQYVEQCYIASVEKLITHDEFKARVASIPFSPLLNG